MNVLFFGRKPVSVSCLSILLKYKVKVLCVCGVSSKDVWWAPTLESFCKQMKITFYCKDDISKIMELETGVDYLFSVLFPERIPKTILDLAKYGAINFHPAPLPDFRGVGGYNFAILEKKKRWGVTAHFMDERIDTGDIILDREFDIDPKKETAFSLERKSQRKLLELFKDILDIILAGKNLPRRKQEQGRYISKREFEQARKISISDPPDLIERKIRAFWYPPYPGAYIEIDGKEYMLIDSNILKEISIFYHTN